MALSTTAVDYDPFAKGAPAAAPSISTPVDYDPFAKSAGAAANTDHVDTTPDPDGALAQAQIAGSGDGTIGRIGTQIGAGFKKSAGGILAAAGNSGMADLPSSGNIAIGDNDPQAQDNTQINAALRKSPMSPANVGKQIAASAQKVITDNTPGADASWAAQMANSLAVGIGETLPGLLGSVLTHSAAPIIAQTAAMSFGNNYADAIATDPNDPHGAAMKATALATVDTAVTAIGLKAFGILPFKSVAGQITNDVTGEFTDVFQQSTSDMIKNLMAQGVAIQPAIGMAGRAVDNWINKKPITDGMGDEYLTGAIQNTLTLGIAHLATGGAKPTIGDWQKPASGTVQDIGPGMDWAKGSIDGTQIYAPGTGPDAASPTRLTPPIDPQDIHPGDEESPIDTSIIAAGRAKMREALSPKPQVIDTNDILARNGLPNEGTPVTLSKDGAPPLTGTIHSGYNFQVPGAPEGTTADGLRVTMDTGEMLEGFKHEWDAAGVTITPQQLQQAGLPLDLATQPTSQPQPQAGTAEQPPAAAPVAQTQTSATDVPAPAGVPVDLFHTPAADSPQTIIPVASDSAQPIAAPAPVQSQPIPAPATASAALPEPVTAPAPPTTGDGTQAAPIKVTHPDHVEQASALVNTAPSDAQNEAGNYVMGHITVQGLPITIENPAGSVRSGTDADGTPWQVTMPATYGYIKRTTGADGDNVDVYVGPNPTSPKVFVIDQKDAKTGAFDEHKTFLGFDTKEQAVSAYIKAFSDGLGQHRIGGVQEMNTLQFKKLLNSGTLDKPIATSAQVAKSDEFVGGNGPKSSNMATWLTVKPIVKTGRPLPPPNNEMSAVQYIRHMGGIKTLDDQGKRTKEGQDINAVLKDVNRIGLINNTSGARPDTIRENMKAQGWFGSHPEAGTDIQDLYDLIDKEVREGPQYHPDSDKGRALAEKAIADDNARVLQDIHDEVKQGGGKPISDADAQQIVANMGEHGKNAFEAVSDHFDKHALRLEYEHDAEATHPGTTPGESVPEREGTVNRVDGPDRVEPAPDAGEAGRSEAGGHPTPHDAEAPLAAEPAAEVTRDNPMFQHRAEPGSMFDTEDGSAVDGKGNAVPQTVIPGAERDAVQLAKAREAAGHGKSTTSVKQKAAGGLFGGDEPPEPEQGALFQKGEGKPPAAAAAREEIYPGVNLLSSPEHATDRAALAKEMRQYFDDRNLHAVGVRVADAIENMDGGNTAKHEDGVYIARIVYAALDAKDASGVMTHEIIHAVRRMGFISKPEWAILEREANAKWLTQYADKLKGYRDDEKIEEAVAFAHQDWSRGRPTRFAIINRIFSGLRDAFNKIRSAFAGRDFHSPEDVFGTDARAIFEDIERGKVGARGPGGGNRSEKPAFQHADVEPPEEPKSAIDKAWDSVIAAHAKELGWEGEPTSRAMYLKAMLMPKGEAGNELIRKAGLIKALEDQRASPFNKATTPIKGDGETKVRGTAQSIADKAAKSGMVVDDLQTYDVAQRKPIMERARKFVNNDANYEQSKAVAMGTEPAPYGTTPNSILIAVEERAARENDIALTKQLAAHSSVLANNTEMAREIGMNAERDPLSAAVLLKQTQKARESAAKANGAAPTPKAKKDVVKQMADAANKEAKKSAKKLSWETFIHSITCEDS